MQSTNTIKSGHLDVGDGHQIYYEHWGNPTGIPVLFLHGGPGLGCSDHDKVFFDPAKYQVLFFDQRGAARSLPKGKLEANTTDHLVADINQLLDLVGFEKVTLFGGSWGSTLAMIYAIRFPKKVEQIILRNPFVATEKSVDVFDNGTTALIFPEAWERYIQLVPKSERKDSGEYYLKMMMSDNSKVSQKYIFEYALYSTTLAKKGTTVQQVKKMLEEDKNFLPKLIIQAHFVRNNFFVPDQYIYEHAHLLDDIPVQILQGRYDLLCTPVFTYALAKKLKNAKLTYVDASHISSEPPIENQLKEIMKKL